MCVILYKPSGVALPPESTLKDCWDRHSDGAGVMFRADNKIKWVKGFMTWDSLRTALAKPDPDLITITDMVIHFRQATHGLKDAGNTHPFIISSDPAQLRAESGETEGCVMAHNGIFTGLPTDTILSDTQVFIRDIVAPNPEIFYGAKPNSLLAALAIGSSRVLFMTPEKVTMLGTWHTSQGCQWSNLQHVAFTAPARGHDDDNDYYYVGRHGGRYYTDRGDDGPAGVPCIGHMPGAPACVNCQHAGPHLAKTSTAPKAVRKTCRRCWNSWTKYEFVPKPGRPVAPAVRNTCINCAHYELPRNQMPCQMCVSQSRWRPATEPAATPGAIRTSCSGCVHWRRPSADEPCRSCLASGSARPHWSEALPTAHVVPTQQPPLSTE